MKYLIKSSGWLVLVALWWTLNQGKIVDPLFLPSPIATLTKVGSLFLEDSFLSHLLATTTRVFTSCLFALIIGTPLGLLLGSSQRCYEGIEGVLDFFRSIPATALFPIFLFSFGVGDVSKVALASFSTSLIVLFFIAHGVRHAPKERAQSAKLMGANSYQIIFSITLWECLPLVFGALRQAFSLACVIIIVTEMFIGTNVGIGRQIIDFQIAYRIEEMYGAVLLAGGIGFLFNLVLARAEAKYIHW